MLAAAIDYAPRARALFGALLRSRLAWCIAAAVFLGLRDYLADPGRLFATLGDTDDATRLVEVRELMAGAPWFDMTLPRMGIPDPLLSHWSRLIDLPLAVLITVFGWIFGPDGAELAARIVWPLVMFTALAWIVVREAEREAGPLAAFLALGFALTSASALFQFNIGRIDHHNAQILGAVGGLLLLLRSLDEPRLGWAAGALFGFSLAVGYEALAIAVPSLLLVAGLAIWNQRLARPIAHTAVAAAAVLALAFVATVSPSRWADVHCDALSANLVLLAAAGAAGLWIIAVYGSGRPLMWRLGVVGIAGAAGIAAFGLSNPVCLGGPLAGLDPALTPLWLDKVLEAKSAWWLSKSMPAEALSFFLFAAIGWLAQIAIWRRDRTIGSAVLLTIVSLSLVLGLWQIRLMPYASWIAIVPIACVIARLPDAFGIPARTVRLGAAVMLNQTMVGMIAASLIWFGGLFSVKHPGESHGYAHARAVSPCFYSDSIRPLAALPAGLVVANLDLGPYILALTPHNVLAGPYHRLDKSILMLSDILNGTVPEAERLLHRLKADYVALCTWEPNGPRIDPSKVSADTLTGQLLRGNVPPYLQAMPQPAGSDIRIWRVRKSAS